MNSKIAVKVSTKMCTLSVLVSKNKSIYCCPGQDTKLYQSGDDTVTERFFVH